MTNPSEPSGSSVPEAARAAALMALATKFAQSESPVNLVVDAVLDAAAPHIVEAALLSELTRLSQAAHIHQGERPSWPFVAGWLNQEAAKHTPAAAEDREYLRAALASPGEES